MRRLTPNDITISVGMGALMILRNAKRSIASDRTITAANPAKRVGMLPIAPESRRLKPPTVIRSPLAKLTIRATPKIMAMLKAKSA